MSSRDNPLWLQLWRDELTDFHQQTVNPLLTRFWPQLGYKKGSRVFVPLCGKSLDMIWLAEQGHEIIGVELSPLAIDVFFEENNLPAVKQSVGEFTLWKHENISIFCGDFFSLHKMDLGSVDIVYDRAALTALPKDIRKPYIKQLRSIINKASQVFLLTIEDADDNVTLEQAMGIDNEIKNLYAKYFNINLIHVESIFESNPEDRQLEIRVEYKAYQLSRKI